MERRSVKPHNEPAPRLTGTAVKSLIELSGQAKIDGRLSLADGLIALLVAFVLTVGGCSAGVAGSLWTVIQGQPDIRYALGGLACGLVLGAAITSVRTVIDFALGDYLLRRREGIAVSHYRNRASGEKGRWLITHDDGPLTWSELDWTAKEKDLHAFVDEMHARQIKRQQHGKNYKGPGNGQKAFRGWALPSGFAVDDTIHAEFVDVLTNANMVNPDAVPLKLNRPPDVVRARVEGVDW